MMYPGENQNTIETNNDWAKNVKDEHLFIDHALSGRKGYFCIGCDKEMEAVIKRKNPKHRSYFRHVAVDVNNESIPCTFSNRKYRETVAIDILQRLKRIKVPSLYKYPPKCEKGNPKLLHKSKFITANKVRSQLTFYESSDGTIKYGKNQEIEERYLLLKPDVVFFDINDNPILFIELVATHKINDEKRVKLRRLGIDTISVIIPKNSEQEIEENFKSTKRIKWEYNEDEANTNYFSISSRVTEAILEIDTEQRRIFEESYHCRKVSIKNAIRSIKKCLATEQYRRTKYLFEQEISRIEGATVDAERKYVQFKRRTEENVFSEFSGDYQAIEIEEEKLRIAEDEFRAHFENLEQRYYRKKGEYRKLEDFIERAINDNYDSEDFEGDIRERIRKRGEDLKREYACKSSAIEQKLQEIRRKIKDVNSQESALPEAFVKLEEQERGRFKTASGKLEIEQGEDEHYFKESGENLNRRFKTLRKESIKKINKEDCSGDTELSKRIESVLEIRRISSSFRERQDTYKRYKAYLEFARNGTWKKQ